MKMIICSDLNGNIGRTDGSLLYKLPNDMKQFKEKTTNQVVVMGRKTFESLPFENGLPDRQNVVLTNNRELYENKPRLSFNCIESFIDLGLWMPPLGDGVWVCGGAEIYNQLIDVVDEIHWTLVYDKATGDDLVRVSRANLLRGFTAVSVEELEDEDHHVELFVYKRNS